MSDDSLNDFIVDDEDDLEYDKPKKKGKTKGGTKAKK
jgi:hypothetical protein